MIQYLHIRVAAIKARMDERGASAVEYGLLVAGIAAVIVAIVFLLGDTITGAFRETCNEVATETGDAATAAKCAPPAPPPSN